MQVFISCWVDVNQLNHLFLIKLLQLNKYIKYKVLEMKSKMTKLLKVFPLLLSQHDSST